MRVRTYDARTYVKDLLSCHSLLYIVFVDKTKTFTTHTKREATTGVAPRFDCSLQGNLMRASSCTCMTLDSRGAKEMSAAGSRFLFANTDEQLNKQLSFLIGHI